MAKTHTQALEILWVIAVARLGGVYEQRLGDWVVIFGYVVVHHYTVLYFHPCYHVNMEQILNTT